MEPFQPEPIPVAPNASQVRGTVIKKESLVGEPGSVWSMTVEEAQDVEGLHNLVKPHQGQAIRVYVAPEMEQIAQEKDQVSARLTYQGDENGGAFYLLDGHTERDHVHQE